MSHDLRVWTTTGRPDLTPLLPTPHRWAKAGDELVLTGRGWQLVVGRAQAVDPEDVPDEVRGVLPGLAHLVEIRLEPIQAPPAGYQAAGRAARALAKALHGVVEDPQEDSVTTPPGVKRFVTKARTERFAVIQMSWWFDPVALSTRAGLERWLATLEDVLPEALPRRYGLWEPPPFRYEETGRRHLLDFLFENRHDFIVWYPRRPALGLYLLLPEVFGPSPSGFRTGSMTVMLEAAVLDQPGWERALGRAWRALSELLRPFYGDVRTLRGYARMGATYSVTAGTEEHPIGSWFWNGLPATLGQAVVLGPPYLELWPAFAGGAEAVGDLAFRPVSSWTGADDLADALPVPPELCQPGPVRIMKPDPDEAEHARRKYYPRRWPFAGPYETML